MASAVAVTSAVAVASAVVVASAVAVTVASAVAVFTQIFKDPALATRQKYEFQLVFLGYSGKIYSSFDGTG